MIPCNQLGGATTVSSTANARPTSTTATPGRAVVLGLAANWQQFALLVAIGAGAYAYLKNKPVSLPPPVSMEVEGEPLKLKLDYRLR